MSEKLSKQIRELEQTVARSNNEINDCQARVAELQKEQQVATDELRAKALEVNAIAERVNADIRVQVEKLREANDARNKAGAVIDYLKSQLESVEG